MATRARRSRSYFFGVALVNQATLSWDAWNIDRWIREGEMNYRLTRPVAPIHEAIADNVAYKGPTATIILIGVDHRRRLLAGGAHSVRARSLGARDHRDRARRRRSVFSMATRPGCSHSGPRARRRSSSCSSALSLFLSGRIAPLSLLPPRVAHVAELSLVSVRALVPGARCSPARVTTTAQYARGFAGQLIWLAIWLLLYLLVWTRGRRHYGAVGG